ncbi:hypothetical protein QVD99_004165 [Batrachochytrium dendrobatidis]|nr:hypothetical protein O5D80_005646 [Batrachochytrium dendrobatidis]KAK5669785.1 hypothetical protein QVD99_004165 [Batrachochytrium dendrobatidis]
MQRRSARNSKPVEDTSSGTPVASLFDDMIFAISSKAASAHPSLSQDIKTAGGGVVASVTKKVTHVIALESEVTAGPLLAKVKSAVAQNIPLVSPDLIITSIASKKLNIEKFILKPPSDSPVSSPVQGPSKNDPVSAKRASSPDLAKPTKAIKPNPKTTNKKAALIKSDAKVDVKTDLKAKIDDQVKPDKQVVAIKKSKSVVDYHCSCAKTTHVVEDGDEIYDAMLSQTNISENNNKFYIIQILKDDSVNQYFCWKRWGRVGVTGQSNLTTHATFDQAFREFCRKFREKTQNDWKDKTNFVKYPGKYFLIERDFGCEDEDEKETSAADSVQTPIPESKLHPSVKELMELCFNMDMMNLQMMEIGYDTKKMPLGKLSKANIHKGYEVLKKLSDVIQASEPNKADLMMRLSSEFYTIIPHEFGMSRPPVIQTLSMLKDKLSMVEALTDIQIATSIIKTTNSVHVEHPMDVNYRSLMCNLVPVDRTSDTFKMVCDYTKLTHGKTHSSYALEVLDVFDVERFGESDRYIESSSHKLDNRMLLWHGSRLTNFVGILSQGLRIAPPEAPSTGYMFGKGVYFADMVSKSANYCFTNSRSNTGILLLCEVALGKTNDLVQSDYHADKKIDFKKVHSTKGIGRNYPDPKQYIKLEDGVVVPAGSNLETKGSNGYLQYNEYIVYRVDQIRIRYLVKMNFKYK